VLRLHDWMKRSSVGTAELAAMRSQHTGDKRVDMSDTNKQKGEQRPDDNEAGQRRISVHAESSNVMVEVHTYCLVSRLAKTCPHGSPWKAEG
jgi:hypothetical protein